MPEAHDMQKKLLLAFAAIGALFLGASDANAQSLLNLPRASQHAQVSQRVGITDINLVYSRPLVNGRKVWGGLVPYGQVWRAGANENTTIEFSDPVSVEGKPLAKGVYGLHMIPGENEWTVIFSKNATSWGSFSYKQDEDALRVSVKPQPSDSHEALTYDFSDVKPDSAVIALEWEKVAVPFKVSVDTHDVVQASLKDQLRSGAQYTWVSWDEAASYLTSEKFDLQDAVAYSDHSIRMEERFDNLLTKSMALDALGKKDDAAATKSKALEMANAIQLHGYGRYLQSQGKHDEALELFRVNVKRNPSHWLAHNDAARLACAKGDFDGAVKEMKIAATGAPEQIRPQVDNLIKRLQAKEDINR
jgi:tetratricopeptide (TPR) repeat protein